MDQIDQVDITEFPVPRQLSSDLEKSIEQLEKTIKARVMMAELSKNVRHQTNRGVIYEDVLNSVFDLLRTMIPFDRLGIALLDENQQVVKSHWVKSTLPVMHLKKNYSAPLAGSSLKKILETGLPRVINDLSEYLRLNPRSISTSLILKDGIRSSLTFPLISNSKTLGFIFFSSRTPNKYSSTHIELFSEVAEEIVLLVEFGKFRAFFNEKRAKEDVLSTVIHDLRSPLGVIQGYLNLIQDEEWSKSLGAPAKEIFAALERNAQMMLSLVSDLSEVNQIEKDREPLQMANNHLGAFLLDFCKEAQFSAKAKNIQFIEEIDPNLPSICRFDARRILQVLQNLLSNALKFSQPNTKVFFAVHVENERLHFVLRDQGQGIPEKELPKLFHWFGRTSTRPTGNEPSTGLGLSICKKIVELHGGEICASSLINQGSTFSFWIPIVNLGQIDNKKT